MLRFSLALTMALAAGAAEAADQLTFGPPADWVKVAPPPAAQPPAADGPPIRIVRFDQQINFGPEGDSTYMLRSAQVRTPMGLQGLGTIAVTWDQANESVTVHGVRIIRDGKAIDVLARQKFQIIRREAQLQQIVDGQLTATLQPEDLRVGDVLEVAYTQTRKDPVLQGRTDGAFYVPAGANGLEVDTVSLRALWPTAEPITWRAGTGLEAPKVTKRGPMTELTLELKNPQTPKLPTGAPARYWPTRELEFTEFRSWAEVGALTAPLFEKASTLAPDSPLREEVRKIAAKSKDPKVRAALALKLVQDEVRYLGLVLTDGGYTPVHADETWRRRFGECKAKTALLMALLKELGIKAEPALVNAYGAPTLDRRLPRMGAFNHVLVRAEIDGRVYWLDGTRAGDAELDALDVPGHDWALPVRAQGSELVALVRQPRDKPDSEIALEIDATAGLEAPAPVKGVMTARGDPALYRTLWTSSLAPADREKMLKSTWGRYPWIEVKSVSATRDEKTGESRIVMEGTAKLAWQGTPAGQRGFYVPDATMGYRAQFKRDPGPDADIPYAVPYPSYTAYRLTMKLPQAGEGFGIPAPDVDEKVAGRHYQRRSRVEKGVLTIEASVRALAPEFPASEATAAAETLTRLAENRVVVLWPRLYRPTPGDIAAWGASEPKTAQEFIQRGGRLMTAFKPKEALADFEKAVALDPNSSPAYANRGIARLEAGDVAGGKADLEKAASLNPRNAQVQAGLGDLAVREGRLEEAVTAYTRASDLQENNGYALRRRAAVHQRLGETAKAIADYEEVLRMDPRFFQAHTALAEIHVQAGDTDKALKSMDAAIAQSDDGRLPLMKAVILSEAGRKDEAYKVIAASLAAKPTPEAYLTRARLRDGKEMEARLADIAAAEKLKADALATRSLRAQVYVDGGQPARAIPLLSQSLAARPDDLALLTQRAAAYVKAGQRDAAVKDFATLREESKDDATALNNLCWTQATLGVELEMALADCDAALKLQPKAAHILDSRGFVLLRLGRHKESVEAYDAALTQRTTHAESLYGRGLAKLRLGQDKEGRADLAAAQAKSSTVEAEFTGYGIPAPATGRAQADAGPTGR